VSGDTVKHVLVVDADAAIGHMLSLILQKEGHRMMPVTSGEAAIFALRANQVDVVLADASLGPGIGCLALCAHVRREWPQLKVILGTRTVSVHPSFAQACGADDVLLKPYNLADLRRAMDAPARHQHAEDTSIPFAYPAGLSKNEHLHSARINSSTV
jgi:DNA-binding response OmpR family regulator